MSDFIRNLLQDATFWFGVAWVIFVALAFILAKKPVAAMFDSYAIKIKSDLEQAAVLHAEAAKLLAETEARHGDALREADAIMAEAGVQAEAFKIQAAKDLEAALKRREQQAEDRIRLLEEQIRGELRAETARLALKATEHYLRERLSAEQDSALIEGEIRNMTSSLKKVA